MKKVGANRKIYHNIMLICLYLLASLALILMAYAWAHSKIIFSLDSIKNNKIILILFIVIFICLFKKKKISTYLQEKVIFKNYLNIILFLLVPLFSFYNFEYVVSGQMFSGAGGNLTILLNYFYFLCIYSICYLFTSSRKFAVLLGNLFFYIVSLVFYFVELFRGIPVMARDLYCIQTAVSISENYVYEIRIEMVLALLLYSLFTIAIFLTKEHREKKHLRISYGIEVLYIGVCIIVLFAQGFLGGLGYEFYAWNPSITYAEYGSVLGFVRGLDYIRIEKPNDYSVEAVEALITLYTSQDEQISGENPNIIVIMNESLADFSYGLEYEINYDPLEYYHSLNSVDNAFVGYTAVSVFGAGTSNSEYEFLTNNTMGFLNDSIVYRQNIISEEFSLAWQLKENGYITEAFHPYYGSNWDRDRVYPLLGFDNFYDYESYDVDSNDYIRNYISDSASYKNLIEHYESNLELYPEKNQFLFLVTMQNHGGYDYGYYAENNFLNTDEYLDVEEYLALINESDKALIELISYFENRDEPVIVVMYGDHYPALAESFYEEAFGKAYSEFTEEQLMYLYCTPFVILANYDVDMSKYESKLVGLNYLSIILLDIAGIDKTTYQNYLFALYKTIPVVNKFGYSIDGNYIYSFNEQNELSEDINNYMILQYAEINDKKNFPRGISFNVVGD